MVKLAFIVCGVVAVASTSATTPFVPERVDVPLNFDGGGRYVITVEMDEKKQFFHFVMSTGTGLTYVTGTQCHDCTPGLTVFNQTASPTVHAFNNATTVPYFTANTSASSIVKEDCYLALLNGSHWFYPNQTIIVTDEPAAPYQDFSGFLSGPGFGVSGMVGLGTNRGQKNNASISGSSLNSSKPTSTYQPNFEDSVFGQWLLLNPTADNFTFGVALNAPRVKPKQSPSGNTSLPPAEPTLPYTGDTAGIVHWLQPDPSYYDADTLQFVTAGDSVNSLTSDPQDWTVAFNGWTFVDSANQVSNRQPIVVNIDPLYQGMYLPLDQATLIHDAIPGAILRPTTSTLGSLAQSWSIPCDSQFTFGIIAGSQTYSLPTSSLVINMDDGTCLSAIEAWTSSETNSYLLGARFMSTIYLIFNIPRDGQGSIGFASRAQLPVHHINVGAIIGGTIGGVAFLALCGLAIWFFFVRNRYRRDHVRPYTGDHVDIEDKLNNPDVVPYTGFTPSPPASASPTQSAFSQSVFSQTALHHHLGDLSTDSQEVSPSHIIILDGRTGSPVPSSSVQVVYSQNTALEDGPPAYQTEESGASQPQPVMDGKERLQ
ncbi:hypothetical protein K474DRAFT_1662305 [Panus rudis PR-1116 ss-1]|nr:hypothetical protein K474DRAFT_1662305 [Panus rudis PR-1116 ss-1]